MTAKQQTPVGQTYHQVLADHVTNLPEVHRRAVTSAITEHEQVLRRCAMLAQENQALIGDVARLTRKLHGYEREREQTHTSAKRVNGQRADGKR
jgi:hypothetical protein